MRIDLPAVDSWMQLSDFYRAELAKDSPILAEPAVQIQVFRGYGHALWEATLGLARLFAHKKAIALIGRSPVFETIAKRFSEDGFEVHFLEDAVWIEANHANLLFVLYSVDDPVTGRLQDVAPIEAQLKEKRIFRLVLSHAAFRAAPLTRPAPFEVRLLSLNTDRCLLVAGERCRIQAPVAQAMAWPLAEPTDFLPNADLRSEILAFEQALPEGFRPYFKPEEARVYDRVAFYHFDFDGSAVIEVLARLSGLSVAAVGTSSALEATSPCRWENPRMTDWLLARGEPEEIVRGLILIAARDLAKVSALQLAAAARELRQLQTPDFT